MIHEEQEGFEEAAHNQASISTSVEEFRELAHDTIQSIRKGSSTMAVDGKVAAVCSAYANLHPSYGKNRVLSFLAVDLGIVIKSGGI